MYAFWWQREQLRANPRPKASCELHPEGRQGSVSGRQLGGSMFLDLTRTGRVPLMLRGRKQRQEVSRLSPFQRARKGGQGLRKKYFRYRQCSETDRLQKYALFQLLNSVFSFLKIVSFAHPFLFALLSSVVFLPVAFQTEVLLSVPSQGVASLYWLKYSKYIFKV